MCIIISIIMGNRMVIIFCIIICIMCIIQGIMSMTKGIIVSLIVVMIV